MHVTLIGTRHKESGGCNSHELYQILMSLNPDVIFEEMPPKEFDDYYISKKRTKLESIAILKYTQNHSVIQVPIDSDNIPEKEFLEAYENIHKVVDGLSDQNGFSYRHLTKTVSKQTFLHGFRYLNSVYYSNAWIQVNEIIANALKKIDSNALFEALAFWNHINMERENQMLNNIYTFCQNSEYKNAVFLIGAYHRNSIIDKISKIEQKLKKVNLVWSFNVVNP
jgi:hypothetical protein